MYAIRTLDTHRFFIGFDHNYTPPKPSYAVKRKVMRYFNSEEDAAKYLKLLGEDNHELVLVTVQTMGLRRRDSIGSYYR